MNLKDIANLRLANQQITRTKFTSAKEIVAWMGAMQAQDYAMVKWAVGVRLPNSTEKSIEAAMDKGEIIRTHVLRPTWHLVSADDLRWMLDLDRPANQEAVEVPSQGTGIDRGSAFKKPQGDGEIPARRESFHARRFDSLAQQGGHRHGRESRIASFCGSRIGRSHLQRCDQKRQTNFQPAGGTGPGNPAPRSG